MSNKKITVVRKDQKGKNRKFNIDLEMLSDEILSALEGVSIQQSTFVSRTNKAKKPGGKVPSPRDLELNLEEGLNRIYGGKSVSSQEDYPENINPFASLSQKIKSSAGESKKLSRFKVQW